MDAFPFSDDDWQEVIAATAAITSAVLADDEVLAAAQFVELQYLLEELARRYGPHPALIETEADFTTDAHERDALYLQAIQLSSQHGLQTWTMRLSRADVLLNRLHATAEAWRELQACQADVESKGDDDERATWQALVEQCRRELERRGEDKC